MARDDDGKLVDIGGEGIIIPLAEVSNIVLSVDPADAPTAPASTEDEVEPPAPPAAADQRTSGSSSHEPEPPPDGDRASAGDASSQTALATAPVANSDQLES